MSALTTLKRTELEDELTILIAELASLRAAYLKVLSSGMKSYKFDSGEASQSATYMSVSDLKAAIDLTASQVASKRRTLTGGGFRRMTLNRKAECNRFGSGNVC